MDNEQKTVIITGAAGMDGSTLSDIYLAKGWRVIGIDGWHPEGKYPNLVEAWKNNDFILETGDITEREWIASVIKKYEPDIFYNMAAISLVPESHKIPTRVFTVNTLGVLNILETLRYYSPKTKFYQASSSEQIGDNTEPNQNIDSRMLPNSPYAVSKLASFHLVRIYRRYGLFAVNGMLWNHEGPRRGPSFVTRKITLGVSAIAKGKKEHILLGNLNAHRDWGLAQDFCEAMVMMMEADKPDDYAVSTGEVHSIREFVEEAFSHINIKLAWEGTGLDEVGVDENGVVRVKVDPKYYRPTEVQYLHGSYTKTKEQIGWEPKTKFKDLVKLMMENDLKGD